MLGINCFSFVRAALVEHAAHSSSAHSLGSTVQFVCYLFVLSCNLKVSDIGAVACRSYSRGTGALLELCIKPEKLQYHIIISKRKLGSARVFYQLVYTRMSHQCYQPSYTEKPVKSTVSNGVFSWVSPQKNTHVAATLAYP